MINQERNAANALKGNTVLRYSNNAADICSSNAAKSCKGIFAQFPQNKTKKDRSRKGGFLRSSPKINKERSLQEKGIL